MFCAMQIIYLQKVSISVQISLRVSLVTNQCTMDCFQCPRIIHGIFQECSKQASLLRKTVADLANFPLFPADTPSQRISIGWSDDRRLVSKKITRHLTRSETKNQTFYLINRLRIFLSLCEKRYQRGVVKRND